MLVPLISVIIVRVMVATYVVSFSVGIKGGLPLWIAFLMFVLSSSFLLNRR